MISRLGRLRMISVVYIGSFAYFVAFCGFSLCFGVFVGAHTSASPLIILFGKAGHHYEKSGTELTVPHLMHRSL